MRAVNRSLLVRIIFHNNMYLHRSITVAKRSAALMGCCQICTPTSSHSLIGPATFARLVSPPVQRHLSSAHSQVTEKQVMAGTEAWIREWITKQKMCPYAQRSNYKIVPVCSDGDEFSSTFMNIFHQEVESLATESQEDGQQMANTLLVFAQL